MTAGDCRGGDRPAGTSVTGGCGVARGGALAWLTGACDPAAVALNRTARGLAPGASLRGEPVARAVFAGLPARYDLLGLLLSFGQDRRWRRAVVAQAAAVSPRLVLDVATGPAGVALAVAGRTGADVVGVDLNEPMLRAGLPKLAGRAGPGRVALAAARADQLPFPSATFDAVTFSYQLRDVDDPAATIAELARCLRPGGVLASLEFAVPPRRAWRACWWCYTRAGLPLLGGLAGGRAWFEVGRFLGRSISAHYQQYPLAAQVAAWQAAGLTGVSWRLMSLGGGLIMWGRRPAATPSREPGSGP
jgi:demethylmenaquinone methyltransferase/2-methoxy-6-polyprenyl-1,4-benzoquinol methylase